MEMQKQAMPEQQQAPAEGGPAQIISSIHSGMVDLMTIMDQTKVATPADKQKLAAITEQFQSLIDGLGQQEPEQPAPMASPEAGARAVKPSI